VFLVWARCRAASPALRRGRPGRAAVGCPHCGPCSGPRPDALPARRGFPAHPCASRPCAGAFIRRPLRSSRGGGQAGPRVTARSTSWPGRHHRTPCGNQSRRGGAGLSETWMFQPSLQGRIHGVSRKPCPPAAPASQSPIDSRLRERLTRPSHIALRSTSALSVFSQVKSASSRPKWPYAAVLR